MLLGGALLAAHWCGGQSLPELSLGDVLLLGSEGNYAVQDAQMARRAAEAGRLVARGAFDWRVRAAAAAELSAPFTEASPSAGGRILIQAYEFGLVRNLPAGLQIEPFVRAVTFPRTAGAGTGTSAQGGMSLRIPLTQVGRSHPSTAQFRAASRHARAGSYRYLHTLSNQLREVALAYWDAVEARLRVEIMVAAEARAREIVAIVDRLAAAGERPWADVRQVEAYLADRVTARIAMEHQRVLARERLVVLLGKNGDHAAERPVRPWLPTPPPEVGNGYPGEGSGTALDQRWDLLAVAEERDAALILLSGARIAARNQLDLELGASRTLGGELAAAGPGASMFSVSLTLGQPYPNRAAVGLIAQRQAALHQQQVRLRALRRESEAAVRVADDAVRSAVLETASTLLAKTAHERSVEQERLRLSNGFATVLDVTVAEERMTNALLADLTARARFARALTLHAHERGDLVRAELEPPGERAARILARR